MERRCFSSRLCCCLSSSTGRRLCNLVGWFATYNMCRGSLRGFSTPTGAWPRPLCLCAAVGGDPTPKIPLPYPLLHHLCLHNDHGGAFLHLVPRLGQHT